jgi:tetratricopeptide (TPR) repeat protein
MKARIYPVDPPRTLTIFRVPSTSLWESRMFEVSDLLDWLGYTEAFCQFSKKGWFVALFATAAVLIATCVTDRNLQRVRILRSLRLMAAIGLVGALIAWILPLAAGMKVAEAETFVRSGNYDRAIDRLEAASRIMPVLRHDTSFVSERGKLGFLIGENGPETKLYIASRFESEGRYVEADSVYRSVILDNPSGTPSRREACRALLRDAVHALNSGRIDAAKAQLQEVLAAEATNLKANYTLQLVYLRSGEHLELDNLVSRIHKVYSFFQTPVKDAALSAFYSNSMAAALMADEPAMARNAYRKAVQP